MPSVVQLVWEVDGEIEAPRSRVAATRPDDVITCYGTVAERGSAALPFGSATLQSTRSADVAQLVEQPIRNRQVTGSSPVVGSRQGGTNFGSFRVSYLFFLAYLSFVACAALRDSP